MRNGIAATGDGPRLLDLLELADRSKVSKHTWRLWLRQGKLPAVRLGRRLLVDEADYVKFISANRVEARPA